MAMNLEQAVSYALQNNPGINAERQKLGIGKGQKAQADMLVQYNPQLSNFYRVDFKTPPVYLTLGTTRFRLRESIGSA